MKTLFDSFSKFFYSSKRIVLLILIVVLITVIISTTISILLERTLNLYVPNLGTIRTIGFEAYWDRNLVNKTETIEWGTFWPGSSKNVTFYVQSISNVREITLYLNTTNWKPADISDYMSLSWNYNGMPINPLEIAELTLTLSASSSDSFIFYLATKEVKDFSFNIIISASEYGG